MPSFATPLLALPLLNPAQAHKEITHNEALLVADALLSPVAATMPGNVPPSAPAPGSCWIIGSAPTGAWAGFAKHIALYSDGGWRFIVPVPGMAVWIASHNIRACYRNSDWFLPSIVAQPAGGAVIDTESRAAISAILAVLQAQ